MTIPGVRLCGWCHRPIPATARIDSIYCGKSHRQAAHRFGQGRTVALAADRRLRLAYADPPYPGLARRYYGDHPDYAGEVDHRELASRLQAYDGWAISTSKKGLRQPWARELLEDERVDYAIYVRGRRTRRSRRPVNAWEAVIFRPAREVVDDDAPADVLVYGSKARTTDPRRVIGAKPAPFAFWLFELLAARRGDSLDDLFPGSGGIARAWELFQAGEVSQLEHADGSQEYLNDDASAPGALDAFPPAPSDTSRAADHDDTSARSQRDTSPRGVRDPSNSPAVDASPPGHPDASGAAQHDAIRLLEGIAT